MRSQFAPSNPSFLVDLCCLSPICHVAKEGFTIKSDVCLLMQVGAEPPELARCVEPMRYEKIPWLIGYCRGVILPFGDSDFF